MRFVQKLFFIVMICVFSHTNWYLYSTELFSSSSSELVDEDALTSELRNAVKSKTIDIIAMKRFLSIGINTLTLNRNKINEIFEKIQEKIDQNRWTLLVFSECFFGDTVLNNDEVKYIVGKCCELTKCYKKLIIHVNCLHKFDIKDPDCPSWVKHEYVPIADTEIDSRLINTDKHANFLFANALNTKRVANYSLVIWDNIPISIYRKSTYCNEANDVVNPYSTATHAYEFGNFKTSKLITDDEHGGRIVSLFVEDAALFITRICSDMNKTDFLTDTFLKEILILPANEAPVTSIPPETLTLQVDDKMKLNTAITLWNHGNNVQLFTNKKISIAQYVGICFKLADIEFSATQNIIKTTDTYFSDGQDQQDIVYTEEEQESCCCCCM